jgi:serine phosphatase RsbU (regulator of sigma subunit)
VFHDVNPAFKKQSPQQIPRATVNIVEWPHKMPRPGAKCRAIMENSVKHFVRRILGIHLLLLALLLAVVTLAARHVYSSAKTQAMNRARAMQGGAADQTAHGVEQFYNSILDDLDLLKPDEEQKSDLPDLPTQPSQPRPFANMGIARQAIGAMLVHQLGARARLFVVDEQMNPHPLGEERSNRILNGRLQRPIPAAVPAPPAAFEVEIIKRFSPWLEDLKTAEISPMEVIDDRSIKLVAQPIIGTPRGAKKPQRTGWLVVAVSAKPIELDFLSDVDQHDESAAVLVDETMTIMASSEHALVGKRIDHDASANLRTLIASVAPNYSSTESLDKPFTIGTQTFDPALVTVRPLKVMGHQWFVLRASPLKDVDQVVRDLSREALLWAIFVAISMTGILVSTAGQLIFSRLKMERVRHQMLKNEMRQARQIQLAWLPQKTKTTCSASLLDIASLNRPATHISGDFYNFFELPDGRTAVVIGDVTGHGTAAAFLMATTQLLIRNTLPQCCDPGRCLEEVNHQLTNQVFNGQFVTMQILLIAPRTGEVSIATAGHPAPLITDGQTFQNVKLEPQLVAGLDPRTKYPTERFRLRPGASLLLYTDGVVEAEDPAGECLRLEGLRKGLAGPVASAEALLQRAVSAVNTFRRGRELRDDLTMVAVHLLPAPRAAVEPTSEQIAPEAAVSVAPIG